MNMLPALILLLFGLGFGYAGMPQAMIPCLGLAAIAHILNGHREDEFAEEWHFLCFCFSEDVVHGKIIFLKLPGGWLPLWME